MPTTTAAQILLNTSHHYSMPTRRLACRNTDFTLSQESCITPLLRPERRTPLHRRCGKGGEGSERVGPDDAGELALLRPRAVGRGLLRLPRPGGRGVGGLGGGGPGVVGDGGGGPAGPAVRRGPPPGHGRAARSALSA